MATRALAPPRLRVRLMGLPFRVGPLAARRLANFHANRRGYVSAAIFLLLFILSLGAELIANDKPVLVWFDGQPYFPAFVTYPETTFGGDFPTEADFRDPYLQGLIQEKRRSRTRRVQKPGSRMAPKMISRNRVGTLDQISMKRWQPRSTQPPK